VGESKQEGGRYAPFTSGKKEIIERDISISIRDMAVVLATKNYSLSTDYIYYHGYYF